MAFVLFRSRGGGGGSGGGIIPLTYSSDDPTPADDNTPFVLQTTEGTLYIKQEDNTYLAVDVPDGGLIDARNGLPAPTSEYDDRLGVSNDGIYYVEVFQTSRTAATATFTTYTATGYLGALSTQPQSPQPGQTYYDIPSGLWYHVATSNNANYWVDGGTSGPSGWIHGRNTSEAEALEAINQHIATGVTSGVVFTGTAIQRFSAFVAAVDPETQRRWTRVTSGAGGSGGLTEAQVKAEIRIFAQSDATPQAGRTNFVTFISGAASNAERIPISATTGEFPDERIAPTVARDLEILDAALVANTSTRFPQGKMPTDTLFRTTALSRFPAGLARLTQVATEAQTGNTDRWGDAKLPTDVLYADTALASLPAGLARDAEIVATARAGNTDRWADDKLPTDVLYADSLLTAFPAGLARLTQIATEARSGNTARWPDAKLPTDVLYEDTDVADFPAGLARTTAIRSDATIQDLVGDMVDGGTETGISVTYNATTKKFSFVVSGGTTPPPAISTHQRYGAYGADSTFVVADFTGGTGATTNTMTLSGVTGTQYVAFWSAEQLSRIDATGRTAFGDTNQIDRFTQTRLTISSVNGYQYVSDSAFPAAYINGAWTLE